MAEERIGNWGRWGSGDEVGMLNLMQGENLVRAAQLVRQGRVFSLALPVQQRNVPIMPPRNPTLHLMSVDGGDFAAGAPTRGGFCFADDYIIMSTHGTTHVDALAHAWTDGLMFNGFSGNEVRSTSGARKLGIQNAGI